MNLTTEARTRRITSLAIALGVLLIVSLLNRKMNLPILRMQCVDILRGRDIMTMFVLAPIGILLLWEIFEACAGASRRVLSLLMITGFFFLGLAFGIHEPANALGVAGARKLYPAFAESVTFFDDYLGHWIFFAGMAICVTAICAAEAENPFEKPLSKLNLTLVAIGGIAGAISLYGNSVNDAGTWRDMAVVALCFAIAIWLHWNAGFVSLRRLPFLFGAYILLGGGAIAVYSVWIFRILSAH